jgi:DNA modification methylase
MSISLNKVYCGDCLEVMKDLPGNSIDLIITSPPYNVGKDYGTYHDEVSWDEYYTWLQKVITECYRVLVKGGTVAINVPTTVKWQIDHEYADTWCDFDPKYKSHRGNEKLIGKARLEMVAFNIQKMMHDIDPHLREPIIWVKGTETCAVSSNNKMGCDSDPHLRSVHEMILLGSKGQWFHRGGTGRRGAEAMPYQDYTKDVWFIPSGRSKNHPATFPLEIPDRLIKLFVHAKDAVVLDPFCGIGTTLIAAKLNGCKYVGIDISEEYCVYAENKLETVK